MNYKFRCEQCGQEQEKEISMKDYDKLKNNQVCSKCGGVLKRIIEWQGCAYNLGGYSEVGGSAKWQTNSVMNTKK